MTRKSTVEKTYLTCRSLIVKVIASIVKPDDVEDIAQETFIKSYEADLKQGIKYERTYMLKTAKHLALNHVMSAAQTKNQSLDNMGDLPIHLQSKSLDKQFETKERFIQFCRATDTLSEQVKKVFLLKKVYCLSQKEIAEQLGLSESTVEKHVAKGLLQCAIYLSHSTDNSKDSKENLSASIGDISRFNRKNLG